MPATKAKTPTKSKTKTTRAKAPVETVEPTPKEKARMVARSEKAVYAEVVSGENIGDEAYVSLSMPEDEEGVQTGELHLTIKIGDQEQVLSMDHIDFNTRMWFAKNKLDTEDKELAKQGTSATGSAERPLASEGE